jgi:hypothetical protein
MTKAMGLLTGAWYMRVGAGEGSGGASTKATLAEGS